MRKAWLILESGEKIEGIRFGADRDISGELVFTTAPAGYCEVLTDPRSAGNIVLFTFPLLGNYGIPSGDAPDGKCMVSGVVAREVCDVPSNFRSEGTLDDYLKRNGIPGICGIDTRSLTQLIREKGSVRAVISGSEQAVPEEEASNPVAVASCSTPYTVGAGERAAVLDLGAGYVPAEVLSERGYEVTVFPCDTKAGEILSGGFKGVVISAGPGAPAGLSAMETVRLLLGKIPVMGLGLGHQLIASALGGRCEKLPFGHHGMSCPVKELSTGRVLMTEQNHTWHVVSGTVPAGHETYVNLTDNSCEGMYYPDLNAFSLQFYPDTHCGQEFSYGRFSGMMGGKY